VALARQHDAAQFVALDFHTRRQLFPLSLGLSVPAPGGGGPGLPGRDEVYRALGDGEFTALAFGMKIGQLTDGPAAPALRMLERARRAAARVLH
jgi:hypothetical protein